MREPRAVKTFVPFLCALALAAAALGATGATSKSPAKKRSAEGTATPAPVKKKKPPVSTAEDATPAPAKKKTAPAKTESGETTPEPAKKPTVSEPLPATPAPKTERAPAAILEPEELKEFSAQPPRVQQLITASLALTKLNLTYTFGSAEPARGGMDCSGTIYHVLRAQGFTEVPRDSSGQYVWARKTGQFFAVISTQPDGFEFSDLQPGDLMFWTGTYQTGRDVPISHVMLYLGREKKTGQRVMFGASDGRSYAGIQRWGVSVFDFRMPKADPANPEKRAAFVGYARIPGLRGGMVENAAPLPEAAASKLPEPPTSPTRKPSTKSTRRSE